MKVIDINAIKNANLGQHNKCDSVDPAITTKNADGKQFLFVIENETELKKYMELKQPVFEACNQLTTLANNPNNTLEQRTAAYNKIQEETEKISQPLQDMCDGVVEKAYGVFWIEYDRYATHECEYVASSLELAEQIAKTAPRNKNQAAPHVVSEIQTEKNLNRAPGEE